MRHMRIILWKLEIEYHIHITFGSESSPRKISLDYVESCLKLENNNTLPHDTLHYMKNNFSSCGLSHP